MTPEEAAQVFVDPAMHADDEHFHKSCAVLHRESPVHRIETPAFNPFWVVTKHADADDWGLARNSGRKGRELGGREWSVRRRSKSRDHPDRTTRRPQRRTQ